MTLARRTLLAGCAAPWLAGTTDRLAICSETFAGMRFSEACQAARRIGYAGIEIEPAHLSADPASLPTPARRDLRRMMSDEGLHCVGLHSLFKSPAGLHLTAPDGALRRKSWDYFARLVDLAADLAERPVLVLGSSKQREAVDGATPAEAVMRLTEGLRGLARFAEAREACVLMEPLAPQLCRVVNTLAQAMAIVRAVKSPSVQTIFDTHNTAGELEPLETLLHDYLPWIRHVHLNEVDGRRPGAGGFPFARVFWTLKQLNYRDWFSVEVFDFRPDGETVARLAHEYLRTFFLN